ncbi:Rid family hydrolase [uncultured Paracoccus sp.]|uniref:Rid family hydrolase n=1 Tax=uncultured Paracoccus sp. TaxID=189685 RepID=UPI0025E042FB|nr:Rid family hydrolase [uncultured Paracoccus sp.]
MKNRIFSGAPSEDFAGYAKAVIAGPTIYVTGTTGQDEGGNLPESAAEQTRNILATVDKVLGQADSGLADAVALRTFLTDKAYLRDVAEVLGETFRDIRPTNTLVVCQIPTEGVKVEIEVTAWRG